MGADGGTEQGDQPAEIAEGPMKGWLTWNQDADPFEAAIGPFCFRAEGGAFRAGFFPTPSHLNNGGIIHGGALMAFADFALFIIARGSLRETGAVTVTFNSQFIAAGVAGQVVEATGDVLRETRSLLFIRGIVTQAGQPLLAFSGTLKKLR
ncbi:MAG: PaaI family thioesterase [Hyphomonadaceae bacterium]|nr:PaaI family thioesterase [Hyphomonadaceae bacterium]